MSILKRIFGRDEDVLPEPAPMPTQPPRQGGMPPTSQTKTDIAQDPDAQAIERYRYMLKTAPPEMLEQAHAEAFAKLTPEQRQQVLKGMSQDVPQAERPVSDDPQALARAATRAEIRQPGYMERTFGGMGMGGGPMMGGGMGMGGMGMGGLIGGSLLSGIAGSFIGSSIAHSFFAGPMGMGFGGHGGGHDSGPDVVNNYYGDQNESSGSQANADEIGNNSAGANEVSDSEPAVDESGGFDMMDSGDFGGGFDGMEI